MQRRVPEMLAAVAARRTPARAGATGSTARGTIRRGSALRRCGHRLRFVVRRAAATARRRDPPFAEMADGFLSYRRDDSRSATGRLADGLRAAFGAEGVFRDLDSIAPGQDFEAALARAIGGASVMLAVVGPRWIEIRSEEHTSELQ